MKRTDFMISIVIPVYNEALSLSQLYQELIKVLKKLRVKFEIIFVNDGSTDETQTVIENIYKKNPKQVIVIEFGNNFGKADALQAGFIEAKGEVIITLDGDLQDDPEEIPKFIDQINQGFDLVVGWKKKRYDSFFKNNSSRIFNLVTRLISKVKLHDFNCGYKAYRSKVAKSLNIYGELHRFIPVLAAAKGYKIAEVPVRHKKRQHGKSKYGAIRFLHGFFDLITVMFITRFRLRPLHLFGYLGVSFFSFGFIGGLYLTWLKLFRQEMIGQRPLLLLSVMLMIMGVQIGVMGLVGEQIATTINRKNQSGYLISKKLKKKTV